MMNQRELRAYFDKKTKLRETVLTLEGLRKYQSEQDAPELAAAIADMERESRTAAAELDAQGESVLSALAAVEDAMCRTLATLHYHQGLSWKEVCAASGMASPEAVRMRVLRAIAKAIPK